MIVVTLAFIIAIVIIIIIIANFLAVLEWAMW